MKHRRRGLLAGLILASGLAGCGEAKFDASTDSALQQTLNDLRSNPAKRQLQDDVSTIVDMKSFARNASNGSGGKPDVPQSMVELYKPLDGLTAEQIHAKAETIRAKKSE